MQLVELHRVNTQFYADSGFQLEGTAVLEGYQLYGYTFQIVERSFFELFEQQFYERNFWYCEYDYIAVAER